MSVVRQTGSMRNFNVIPLISLLLVLTSLAGCLGSEDLPHPFTKDETDYHLPGSGNAEVASPSDVTWFISQIPAEDEQMAPEKKIALRNSDTAEVYRWFYGGSYYSWTMYIPADQYNYFATLPRDKPHPADYVMSDRGRQELQGVVSELISLSNKQGFSEVQRRDFVIAFVQSLPHNRGGSVHDYDNYPKYPIQTLYDGGGDSQDTAILLTSILRLLGHQAVLIETPDHYMVGLIEPEVQRETRDWVISPEGYTVIESNHPGFSIGRLPVQYHRAMSRPIIHVPARTPDITLQYHARLIYTDQAYAYYQLYCTITSTGTGPANDLRVTMTTRPTDGSSWRYDEIRTLSTIPEGEMRLVEGTVRAPRNAEAEMIVTVAGPGIAEKKYPGQVFYT